MAFTDPLMFAPDGDPAHQVGMPRTSTGTNLGVYTAPDGTMSIRVEHNYARRTRRVFRVDTNKFAPDPFIPSQNVKLSGSLYVVADLPVTGYTVSEVKGLFNGIAVAMTDPTGPELLEPWLTGQS